uniref:Uncharacterized protein n=1 Tax=Heterorhabditis bacteriophora TaxID=37862 RepID=A0A1I7W7W5_HETBA
MTSAYGTFIHLEMTSSIFHSSYLYFCLDSPEDFAVQSVRSSLAKVRPPEEIRDKLADQ